MGGVLRGRADLEMLLPSKYVLVAYDDSFSTMPQVKRISLSKNILRAIEANPDIPPLTSYPRSHQVR